MEWQPIETVPLNTPILVTGGLMEDELTNEPWEYGVAIVDTGSRKHFSVVHACYYSVWVNSPTHWAPLPAPPTASQQFAWNEHPRAVWMLKEHFAGFNIAPRHKGLGFFGGKKAVRNDG
jgi:hypothetical protein